MTALRDDTEDITVEASQAAASPTRFSQLHVKQEQRSSERLPLLSRPNVAMESSSSRSASENRDARDDGASAAGVAAVAAVAAHAQSTVAATVVVAPAAPAVAASGAAAISGVAGAALPPLKGEPFCVPCNVFVPNRGLPRGGAHALQCAGCGVSRPARSWTHVWADTLSNGGQWIVEHVPDGGTTLITLKTPQLRAHLGECLRWLGFQAGRDVAVWFLAVPLRQFELDYLEAVLRHVTVDDGERLVRGSPPLDGPQQQQQHGRGVGAVGDASARSWLQVVPRPSKMLAPRGFGPSAAAAAAASGDARVTQFA
jgi:hypothetical protein